MDQEEIIIEIIKYLDFNDHENHLKIRACGSFLKSIALLFFPFY